MKKLLLSFLILFIGAASVSAQKTFNDPNAEKRNVSGYHGIDVGTGIELTITAGGTEEVAVSANTTAFRDKIVTKVENGVLKIYYEDKLNSMNKNKVRKDLKAYVSYKTLDKLYANTGARVEIDGTLESASLKMNANTGATINGKVKIGDMEVEQSTGSVITLTGDADKLDVEGDTGSRFKGTDLSSGICDAKVNTGATIAVTANKELSAKAHTGGRVTYKGDAALKDVKKSTGGSVSKI